MCQQPDSPAAIELLVSPAYRQQFGTTMRQHHRVVAPGLVFILDILPAGLAKFSGAFVVPERLGTPSHRLARDQSIPVLHPRPASVLVALEFSERPANQIEPRIKIQLHAD